MPLSKRDRRTLIIGGVIMAVMLAGFFAFNSTQSDQTAAPSFAPIGAPTGSASPTGGPTVVPSGTGSQTPPTSTPTTIPVFTGRDPFSIPAVLVTITPSSSGVPPPPGSSTVPPTGTTTTPPTSPPPTQPGDGSSTVIDGHTVVLLDVFPSGSTHKAQVEVDGHVYNPSVGDKFDAGQFELRSVSGNCATFLYGDQSFGLCATSPK